MTITTNILHNVLIVTIQSELYDESLRLLQRLIMEEANKKGLKWVIIDLSALDILDSFLAKSLFDTSKMLTLQGVGLIFSGLRPEVVASIVDLDVDITGIKTALNLDNAFKMIG